MMRTSGPWLVLFFLLSACASPKTDKAQPTVPIEVPAALRTLFPAGRRLHLPPGFQVELFAAGLKSPRHMAQGADGAIYVAEKTGNRVSRLIDSDHDGSADRMETYATGVASANSVEWHQGALYVGASDGIYRFALGDRGERVVTLPADGGHYTRTAHFGPDGRLYVTIGSTCNVCRETDPHRAAMWVYAGDASGGRLFAKGLRNTVDFAFHPQTGAIFGVDNGRDGLGDEQPPEEVNQIKEGGDYGWPVCHGNGIVDPDFGRPGSCAGTIPPIVSMQAHSAPLGVQFYTGTQFPTEYGGNLFIAQHGSWNRTDKTGYKVVRIPFAGGAPSGPTVDFATGWLTGGSNWGRPVGLLQTKDGALLVSDDQGGVIYRITYAGTRQEQP